MDGGQLDGSTLSLVLSDLPLPPPAPPSPSPSPVRPRRYSPTPRRRSRSPPPRRASPGPYGRSEPAVRGGWGARGGRGGRAYGSARRSPEFGRRGVSPLPYRRGRADSRSRSRSPVRRRYVSARKSSSLPLRVADFLALVHPSRSRSTQFDSTGEAGPSRTRDLARAREAILGRPSAKLPDCTSCLPPLLLIRKAPLRLTRL